MPTNKAKQVTNQPKESSMNNNDLATKVTTEAKAFAERHAEALLDALMNKDASATFPHPEDIDCQATASLIFKAYAKKTDLQSRSEVQDLLAGGKAATEASTRILARVVGDYQRSIFVLKSLELVFEACNTTATA